MSPTNKVAPLPSVNVPPAELRFAVKVPKSSVPDVGEKFKSPATLRLATSVTLTVPLAVKLPPTVVVPICSTSVPLPLRVRL